MARNEREETENNEKERKLLKGVSLYTASKFKCESQ
jgi:hypothetical protein